MEFLKSNMGFHCVLPEEYEFHGVLPVKNGVLWDFPQVTWASCTVIGRVVDRGRLVFQQHMHLPYCQILHANAGKITLVMIM